MENNTKHRKARIYYKGESIPVKVVDEDDSSYELVLDWHKLLKEDEYSLVGAMSKRNLYLDALFGYEGAHENHKHVSAVGSHLALYKDKPDVVLVFGEREPEEAQDDPVDSTGIDDVPPPIGMHGELNQHLTLLARSGYKVKSFDVNIQETGEAHLCATFSKEVDN